MSNIMTSHKSKFQEDTSSSIELIAESYGANTNNAGALTDAELKAFLNIQKLSTSGTVSIVRALQFGDIAGAWNLVDDSGSKGRHHITMETENMVTAIFFSKEKLLDILSKDDKFKKALWKEAAIEVIGLYGIFDEAESGGLIIIMTSRQCAMNHQYILQRAASKKGIICLCPSWIWYFCLKRNIRITDTVIEKFNFISAEVDTDMPRIRTLCCWLPHCVISHASRKPINATSS